MDYNSTSLSRERSLWGMFVDYPKWSPNVLPWWLLTDFFVFHNAPSLMFIIISAQNALSYIPENYSFCIVEVMFLVVFVCLSVFLSFCLFATLIVLETL